MNLALFKNVSLVWSILFCCAFINGAIREVLLKQVLNIQEPLAHHLSVLTIIIIFTFVVWIMRAKLKFESKFQASLTGFYWFILTVLAETFIVSKLIANESWSSIVGHYNIFQGQLWPIVLIWVYLLPRILFRFQKK